MHVRHLRNPLNENLAVLVGKDGQEIAEKTGLALLKLMETPTNQRRTFRRKPSAFAADRDGDGHGRKRSPEDDGERSPRSWSVRA